VRGISKRDAPVLVDVIEQARNLPKEQWPEPAPRELDAPQAQPLVSFLQLVLQHHCARVNLAQPLAATQAELKNLVRKHLAGEFEPVSGLLSAGWRRENILPLLQDALAGKLALRVEDITREEPLGW
jgi:ribonuclease D